MRALDGLGIGSHLAELPGGGESLTDIADVRLEDWHAAIRGYAPGLTASFRGGALLDTAARIGAWRFAPEIGERILRDLKRAALASADTTLLAGHNLSADFLRELEAATPGAHARLRTVRLDSDPAHAEARVPGSPLWRRAEPGEDPALAAALAVDLAQWARACAA